MARFIDKERDLVLAAIDGWLATGQGDGAVRLEGPAHQRVVMRGDWRKDRVALISGGGAGHEPAHVGFVGAGMLTAVVVGDVFASPGVDAIFNAINEVTGPQGCLLIVKNYTGDRLNFGLAAERARALGHQVEMVIVGDDVALPDSAQPRGIAGTLFVHKIAGHVAENGGSLAEVKAAAERTAKAAATVGMALASCDFINQPLRTEAPQAELGLGIHGEPGAEQVQVDNAREAVKLVVDKLAHAAPTKGPVALLLNNLGSVTPLEMSVIARDLLLTPLGQRCTLMFGPGAYMTALNMYGFSVSVLPLTSEAEAALKSAVSPAVWPLAKATVQPEVRKPAKAVAAEQAFQAQKNPGVEAIVRSVCKAIIDGRAELDALDAKVGDGDTGSTLASGATEILETLDGKGLPLADTPALLAALGQLLSQAMGGSSGVLLSILFTAASSASRDGAALPQALSQGVAAMQRYGGAKAGDRTMLDALEPALKAWASGDLAAAAKAARSGADATREMERARAGRSAYLRADSLRGHPDPGAVAVALAFESLHGKA